MRKKVSQDKMVYAINYIMLTLLLLIVLYPIIYIVSCSFSSGEHWWREKSDCFRKNLRLTVIRLCLNISLYGAAI